jgi:hypothetical protein
LKLRRWKRAEIQTVTQSCPVSCRKSWVSSGKKQTGEQGPMIKIARLSNDLEVSFCLLGADRIMLSVYWPVKFKMIKVLSLDNFFRR